MHVKTGDVPNAGTSAGVYTVLYGGKDGDRSSGKILLSDGKFERGRTDIFNFDVAEMLSPLSRIEIGHDNKGPGPGWFLDEVSLTDTWTMNVSHKGILTIDLLGNVFLTMSFLCSTYKIELIVKNITVRQSEIVQLH